MTDLTVIILTKNEACHIARAIASVSAIATRVVVVDSGSSDETVSIAKQAGAQVLVHPWTTHAAQFNWALNQVADHPGWILRLDADEVVTEELATEMQSELPSVDGLYVRRRMKFMGQFVRYGGVFPIQVMRLFRNGCGRCEARWMDEHIVVHGKTGQLRGEIIDDNRNTLDWWITKHNAYASKEVIDILNREFAFAELPSGLPDGKGPAFKRFIKEKVYGRLPSGFRAGAYFFYRYIMRLGCLDGPQARAFHVLQGFWYRYLVDAKLAEVRRYIAAHEVKPEEAILQVLGVDVAAEVEISRAEAA